MINRAKTMSAFFHVHDFKRVPRLIYVQYIWSPTRSSFIRLYIKALSTRIRKFVKTQIFFHEYGFRPHLSSVFSGRIRKFLKTLSRVEIFLSDTITYTCGRSYPEICEYAYVILLDPVFTASIINKHGVQQGCSFFASCSDCVRRSGTQT